MTSIPAAGPASMLPGLNAPVAASGAGGGAGFAALLDALGSSADNQRGPSAELRRSVAEIFDAFGFFPRQSGAQIAVEYPFDNQTTRPGTWDQEGSQSAATPLAAGGEPAQPEKGSAKPPVHDEGAVKSCDQTDAKTGREEAAPDAARLPTGGEEFDIAGLSDSIARPATAGRLPAHSVSFAVGEPERAPVAAEALPSEPQQPESSAQSPEPASAAMPDRLLLTLCGETVEFTGRLPGLSDADEERLSEALGRLLSQHGITLSSAVLNGRRLGSNPNDGGC